MKSKVTEEQKEFIALNNAIKRMEEKITFGILSPNPTIKAIYETFIKLNTCGKPMNHMHIDKVKKLLKEF